MKMEKLEDILKLNPKFWGTITFSTTYTLKNGEVCNIKDGKSIEESKLPKTGRRKDGHYQQD